jgi:hypothetical protein
MIIAFGEMSLVVVRAESTVFFLNCQTFSYAISWKIDRGFLYVPQKVCIIRLLSRVLTDCLV